MPFPVGSVNSRGARTLEIKLHKRRLQIKGRNIQEVVDGNASSIREKYLIVLFCDCLRKFSLYVRVKHLLTRTKARCCICKGNVLRVLQFVYLSRCYALFSRVRIHAQQYAPLQWILVMSKSSALVPCGEVFANPSHSYAVFSRLFTLCSVLSKRKLICE